MLLVRLAEPGDFHRLVDFLEANASRSLPLPTAPTLKEALTKEAIYLVLIGDEVVACAGLFAVCEGPGGGDGDTAVYELAATRVVSAAGGLRPHTLQDLLISLRVTGLLVSLSRDRSVGRPTCFMVATLPAAERSRGAVSREDNRLVLVSETPRWLRLEQRTWALEGGVEYRVLDAGGAATHAARVRRCATSGFLLERDGPQGREVFLVDLAVPWVDWAAEELEALAAGEDPPDVRGLPTARRLDEDLL